MSPRTLSDAQTPSPRAMVLIIAGFLLGGGASSVLSAEPGRTQDLREALSYKGGNNRGTCCCVTLDPETDCQGIVHTCTVGGSGNYPTCTTGA